MDDDWPSVPRGKSQKICEILLTLGRRCFIISKRLFEVHCAMMREIAQK